jgi:Tfp pilus assembly protein PilO
MGGMSTNHEAKPDAVVSPPPEGTGLRLRRLVASAFRRRPLLSWLVVLLAAAVCYLQVVEPAARWVSEARQRAAVLSRSQAGYLDMARRERARLRALRARLSRVEELARGVPRRGPAQARQELEERVLALARGSGLEVTGRMPLSPRASGSYLVVGVRLRARGPYSAAARFLKEFGQSPPPMYLASFRLSRGKEGRGWVHLDCQAVTLVRR